MTIKDWTDTIWVEKDPYRFYLGTTRDEIKKPYWLHIELSGDPYEDFHMGYETPEEVMDELLGISEAVNKAIAALGRLTREQEQGAGAS